MKVTKQIHKGYLEWANCKGEIKKKIRQIFGKWQYIYTSKKGMISLILLKNYNFDDKDCWEIYELSNHKLIEDTIRFSTKKEAEKRIRKLLK